MLRRDRTEAIKTAEEINEQRRAKAAEKNKVKHSGRPRVAHLVPVPRPLGPLTMRRIHNTLSGALKSAVKAGLIPRNPAPDAELPRAVQPKVKVWNAEQLGAFLDAIEGTGCTRSTTWPRSPVCAAGSCAERQEWASAYVDPVDDDGTPYNLVFTRENGAPLDPGQTYTNFVRLVRDAGLPHLKVHGLRHLNISLQLDAGVSETVIAMRVGHTSAALVPGKTKPGKSKSGKARTASARATTAAAGCWPESARNPQKSR